MRDIFTDYFAARAKQELERLWVLGLKLAGASAKKPPLPTLKILRRKSSRWVGVSGTAFPSQNSIILTVYPESDEANFLATLVHEVSHFLVDFRFKKEEKHHSANFWRMFAELASEAYSANIVPEGNNRFELHMSMANQIRQRLEEIGPVLPALRKIT